MHSLLVFTKAFYTFVCTVLAVISSHKDILIKLDSKITFSSHICLPIELLFNSNPCICKGELHRNHRGKEEGEIVEGSGKMRKQLGKTLT